MIKETKAAIEGLKNYVGMYNDCMARQFKAILNYISEIEKEKQQVLDDYQDLGKDLANNFISKEVIREKIEELKNTKGDFATYIAVSERIQVLKELLGEKNE